MWLKCLHIKVCNEVYNSYCPCHKLQRKDKFIFNTLHRCSFTFKKHAFNFTLSYKVYSIVVMHVIRTFWLTTYLSKLDFLAHCDVFLAVSKPVDDFEKGFHHATGDQGLSTILIAGQVIQEREQCSGKGLGKGLHGLIWCDHKWRFWSTTAACT